MDSPELSDGQAGPATSMFLVDPTGLHPSKNYSDIALTNYFNSHILLINSERQAIWQRFTAMLIANSLVVALIARPPEPASKGAGIMVALSGFVLCVGWLILTISGWGHFENWTRLAMRFELKTDQRMYENPISAGVNYATPTDWVYVTAIGIICLFLIGHGLIFTYYSLLK